jgi:hypothetical protein
MSLRTEERPLLSQLRVAVVRNEKLVDETGTVREPRGRGTSVVASRYQAMVSVDRILCVLYLQ